ncbi:MAG: hypothetical protein IT449_01255 [Phycisphaerales bacterium]|nr:hypothetical protein [Phycisphaerales bacterium]
MSMIDKGNTESRSAVDDVRAARAAVGKEAGGLDGLGDYLRLIQEEYRTRTGRFVGLPAQFESGKRPARDARNVGAAQP